MALTTDDLLNRIENLKARCANLQRNLDRARVELLDLIAVVDETRSVYGVGKNRPEEALGPRGDSARPH